MRRLTGILVSTGVACVLLSSAVVVGQVAKTEVNRPERIKEQTGRVEPKQKIATPKGTTKTVIMQKAVVVQGQNAFVVAPGVVGGDPIAEQYVTQFRPILRAEYRLLRSICDLSKDERRKIARDGEQALRETAKRAAGERNRGMRVFIRPAGAAVPAPAPASTILEPRKLIQEGLAKSVEAHLSAEQQASYRAELEKRDADRKRITIACIVARLDQDLILSPEQRTKLIDALTTHWDDSWCPSLDVLQLSDQFFPNVPDTYILPVLDPTQEKIWRTRTRRYVSANGLVFRGGLAGDDAFEDDDLREAREAATKDQAKPK
jgi:hypothetical protein